MSTPSDTAATESIRFDQLELHPALLQAVTEIGYEAPSAIQAATIPPLLAGRDLLGQAQTGTGKTAAFALPMLCKIEIGNPVPQGLVLTPTRELAIQVAEAMQAFARHLPGFHVLPIYGGAGMGSQLRQLERGVHLVVGTPGRVMDHLRRGSLVLDELKVVVLDEADEMLRMGFIDDVEWILEQTPDDRQVALFSATMPEPIRRVAQRYLNEPVEVRIAARTTTVASIVQRYWQVSGLHKLDALTRLLEVEPFDAMIIFVRTKSATTELAEKLEARGYAASALNGDMVQAQREQTVDRLKRGLIDIVIATDVAARGLDVERISHVVNYDIPNDTEAYVHRIGRTGRAGRSGQAILFVSPREKHLLRAIERATRQPIAQLTLPSREQVTNHRIGRFKQLITDTIESEELEFFEALVDGYAAEHDIGISEIAAALAFLVQRERPLQSDIASEAQTAGQGHDERPARGDRPPRGERPPREQRQGGHGFNDEGRPRRREREAPAGDTVRYRIEVGREHGVQPKNIVGAIANEAGIESRFIGHIKLFDHFSTVDLPVDISRDTLEHLRQVWVCGRQLNIHPDGERPAGSNNRERNYNREQPEQLSLDSRQTYRGGYEAQPRPPRQPRFPSDDAGRPPRQPRLGSEGGRPPRQPRFATDEQGQPRPPRRRFNDEHGGNSAPRPPRKPRREY
jgi:ATP-dependent RNA helicase DeaD